MMEKISFMKRPRYAAIVLTATTASYALMVFFPYLFAGDIFLSPYFSTMEKIRLLGDMAQSEAANFYSVLSAVKVTTSLLFGITAALITRHFSLYRATFVSAASTGTLALLASVVGIGCVSCGALFVGTFATLTGLSALFLALPLRGLEFGITGILLLIAIILLLLRDFPSAE